MSTSTVSYAQARLEKAKRLARNSLLQFTLFTKPDYEASWHHVRLCAFIDAFFADPTAQIAIVNMPPQHGKSEIISRRLPAYLLGRNPDLPIIACSHTSDLAGAMNRDVQRIVDEERYAALFPETQLFGRHVRADVMGNYLRNSDMFEVVGRTGYYRSAGVGGNIVGRGFRVGIIDDPHKSREEASSPTTREKVWRWVVGDFLTRRGPGWKVVVVMTRWDRGDVTGRFIDLAQAFPKDFKLWHLCLKAKCEEDVADDPREPGEALWPERFPVEDLEKIRVANAWEWASQYQQNPRPEGGVEWPDDYFGPHLWFDDWPKDIILKVLSLDPSKGKTDKVGDFSAFVLLGLDKDGGLWADADLAQGRPVSRNPKDPGASIVGDGLDLYTAWQPNAFVVEVNGFQELIADELVRQSKERKLWALPTSLYGITNVLPKPTRIRSVGPHLARRELRIRNTPGGRLLVQQLRDFPVGEHDDAPDSLEMAVRMMRFLLGDKPATGAPEILRV
jgi:predicted phage terminase large subunit-like protein